MTSEIASAVQEALQPEGVGVILKATHHCMSSRGIHKAGSDMVTSCMLGCMRDNAITRQEFLGMVDALNALGRPGKRTLSAGFAPKS